MMIHLPCSRIEIGMDSQADWEACKQVYIALKESQTKKNEDDDKQKKSSEERLMADEAGSSMGSVNGSDQKDGTDHGKTGAGSKRGKKSSSASSSSETPTVPSYAGPVTRQRQRQSQNAPDSAS